ncbi:hypothetical protein IT570_11860 [Candidatus Sumerlaeota bacterium]|nr:hypothetical protein [Candidatus Sumerlaeota bacterium]
MNPGEKHEEEDAADASHRAARDEKIGDLHRRLEQLEESRRGENMRLAAMFVLGMSAGISMALLYIEVARRFF